MKKSPEHLSQTDLPCTPGAAPSHASAPRLRPARWPTRLRREESGQTTVIMALIVGTFLMGFVGLGIDVSTLFHARRQAQGAADAAALAAAEEAIYGSPYEQNAANAAAKLNGFDTALGATVTLSVPRAGSNYAGSAAYIQAKVSQPIPTFFSQFVTRHSTVTVAAYAVAVADQGSPTCICLEGATGMDLNLSNNAQLTPNGCGVTVDSSSSNAVGIVGGSGLSGKSLGIVSSSWTKAANVNNGGSINSGTKVVTGISTSCSPTMPAAPPFNAGASCTSDPAPGKSGGSPFTVGPGSPNGTTQQGGTTVCYTALTVGDNNKIVTLNPGIYVINGGTLHFESGNSGHSNLGGNGVFFYLVNGANLLMDNGVNTNLTAPSSGTYSGILFYQPAANTSTISIQGGSSSVFNGAIYAPTAAMTLGNGSGTSITADIVASTLTMNGGGTLASTSVKNLGTLSISVAKVAE
jgi:Flp pilus assembly protein TadG